MPLTPEDGTGVAGADTYATLEECKAYATKRGLALLADETIEVSLVLACDYLQTLNWKGDKTNIENPLEWPREGVIQADGSEMASDEIPNILKQAQCQLACENNAGLDLMPTGSGRETIEETVGPLTTKYAESGSGTVSPQLNKALSMLAPLLDSGSAFTLATERI